MGDAQLAELLSLATAQIADLGRAAAQVLAARSAEAPRLRARSEDFACAGAYVSLGGEVAELNQIEALSRLIRGNRLEWRAEAPLIQLAGVEPRLEVSLSAPGGEGLTGMSAHRADPPVRRHSGLRGHTRARLSTWSIRASSRTFETGLDRT
ncbi:hypothetical protein C8N33_103335 [Pararhodobacter aggregans]|nr:hypothetical protein C8N33_103335 [Pararhodobacter aggregans]